MVIEREPDMLENLAKEMSYRLAKSLDGMVSITADGGWICGCGQNPAVEQIGKYAFCEPCRFRYLVMRAAGREKEFVRQWAQPAFYGKSMVKTVWTDGDNAR